MTTAIATRPDWKECVECGTLYRKGYTVAWKDWFSQQTCSYWCRSARTKARRSWVVDERERFFSKVDKREDHWLWIGGHRGGYGSFTRAGSGKDEYAHRVSWEMAFGPITHGMDVLHTCDVKPCVWPEHLYLGTDVENTRDREERGLANHPFGEQVWTAKLNDDAVLAIRAALRAGRKGTEVAQAFNIDVTTVSNIKVRKTWKHLP